MELETNTIGTNFAVSQVGVEAVVNKTQPEYAPQDQDSEQKGRQQTGSNLTDLLAEKIQEKSESADALEGEEVETAVAEISDFMSSAARSLEFSSDEASGRSVIKVTDSDSGEVIRQIPSEEVLALAERIRDLQTDVGQAVGVFIDKEI